jgi:hypothetical protein
MKWLILIALPLFIQTEIPYKANEEFELKPVFEFKSRTSDVNTVYPNGSGTARASGPLPYLFLDLRIIKLTDEIRIKAFNESNSVLQNRKVKEGDVIRFDMGFTDDLKGHIANHQCTIHFMTADKKVSSRILVTFNRDGTFYVNGELRGKV